MLAEKTKDSSCIFEQSKLSGRKKCGTIHQVCAVKKKFAVYYQQIIREEKGGHSHTAAVILLTKKDSHLPSVVPQCIHGFHKGIIFPAHFRRDFGLSMMHAHHTLRCARCSINGIQTESAISKAPST